MSDDTIEPADAGDEHLGVAIRAAEADETIGVNLANAPSGQYLALVTFAVGDPVYAGNGGGVGNVNTNRKIGIADNVAAVGEVVNVIHN